VGAERDTPAFHLPGGCKPDCNGVLARTQGTFSVAESLEFSTNQFGDGGNWRREGGRIVDGQAVRLRHCHWEVFSLLVSYGVIEGGVWEIQKVRFGPVPLSRPPRRRA
jgi:hypothetical protein